MSKRILSTFSKALALTAFALAGSSAAHAEDGKVYPGTNCHALNSASGAITQYGFNYVENTSTTNSSLLICPAVKDETASTLGLNLVRIRYYKPSTTGFYCQMESRSAFSGSGAGFTSNQWDFGGSGNKTMTLANVLSFADGSYQLYCILPNKVGSDTAKLHSYRLDEN